MTQGDLALVGSGEYTAAMDNVDRLLLDRLRRDARVALLPTASGLEPGMPERWNAQGVAHFEALGATAMPLLIVRREDAFVPAYIEQLASADFFYFSGGDPQYVVDTWRDTPAWAALVSQWQRGAVLAGCSAGAMMLGPFTIRIRSIVAGQVPQWAPALGLLPHITVIPHFDRMRNFISHAQLSSVILASPPGVTVVGVDEDTALVHVDERWQVLGRQGVTIFSGEAELVHYAAGQYVPLPSLYMQQPSTTPNDGLSED
ncbi:MAG: Type 1 glutamine amidotransferase-like domain-containing protein [Herpetosiphonaceae bacterium]|nr:Type 1 glutamine amidotransferase-like domain-containing protein [Herpetosiphonaceae bacterium]